MTHAVSRRTALGNLFTGAFTGAVVGGAVEKTVSFALPPRVRAAEISRPEVPASRALSTEQKEKLTRFVEKIQNELAALELDSGKRRTWDAILTGAGLGAFVSTTSHHPNFESGVECVDAYRENRRAFFERSLALGGAFAVASTGLYGLFNPELSAEEIQNYENQAIQILDKTVEDVDSIDLDSNILENYDTEGLAKIFTKAFFVLSACGVGVGAGILELDKSLKIRERVKYQDLLKKSGEVCISSKRLGSVEEYIHPDLREDGNEFEVEFSKKLESGKTGPSYKLQMRYRKGQLELDKLEFLESGGSDYKSYPVETTGYDLNLFMINEANYLRIQKI